MSLVHFGMNPRSGTTVSPLGVTSPIIKRPVRTSASQRAAAATLPNPYIAPSTPQSGARSVPPSEHVMERTTRSYTSVQQPRPAPVSDKLNELFDRMCESVLDMPLHLAIESAFNDLLGSETSTFWLALPDHKLLYSPGLMKTTSFETSVVSECLKTNSVISCERPAMRNTCDPVVDASAAASIYTPIATKDNAVIAVIQSVAGRRKPVFTDEDVSYAKKMAKKFTAYSHLLFRDDAVRELVEKCYGNSNIMSMLIEQLKTFFKCRAVDFFSMSTDGTCYRYDLEHEQFQQLRDTAGVATFCLKNQAPLVVKDVTESTGYCTMVDGKVEESVMAAPLNSNGEDRWAVVLRGKENKRQFSGADLAYLTAVTPVISRGLARGGSGDEDGEYADESGEMSEKLKALLEVAEVLSGVLDIDALIPIIMERACSLLNTERCSLFLVDIEKQELVSCFQGGLDKRLRVPLKRGIVGVTATTGEIVNIPDAYEDPRFDKSVDLVTGFRTKTILTVPIFNNRGEIAGVTEMINKKDVKPFDEEDIKMLMAFNVFCGISLDNSKLYQSSLDLTRQLRSFVEMSSSLNTTKTVKDVLSGILSNAAAVIHAARATIYLYDVDGDTLDEFAKIGDNSVETEIFAREAVKAREMKIFTKDEVAMKLKIEAVGDEEIPETGKEEKLSRINSLLGSNRSGPFSSSKSVGEGESVDLKNLIAIPLMTSDSRLLGVMELTCAWKIMNEDVKLLDCFSVFAAVSLEKSELKEIATKGLVESNIKHWIAQNERQAYTIPEKLKLTEEQEKAVFSINFDAPLFDGRGHFKVLWAIFDSFHLLEKFQITNEKFFRFLTEISETYKKVPYHNWRHAVDVTQFVQYEIKLVGLQEKLKANELFGLVVAAICHDANHDGFTNVYNEKAETPLGILFKNQSVMETHHCSIAIGVISKEECNIFATLDSAEYKAMWAMIIRLILSTDMAKHFDFLKKVNATLDEHPLNMEDAEDRFTSMDLVLKCADISNVSRPFEMANKWCDVLCEEFFRQGDLEQTNGMEYTSPLNDRAHLDKPKSQIGFYTFVCLPLYEAAARAMPALQVNVDQVKSNLAVWKGEQEKKESG